MLTEYIKLNSKGQVALFVAVSISAFLLYLGLYTMNRNIREVQAVFNAQNSVESYYLADMGVERFQYELKMQITDPTGHYGAYQNLEYLANCINDDNCSDVDNPDEVVTVGDGYYRLDVESSKVIAKGNYRNVNRAIELSYGP